MYIFNYKAVIVNVVIWLATLLYLSSGILLKSVSSSVWYLTERRRWQWFCPSFERLADLNLGVGGTWAKFSSLPTKTPQKIENRNRIAKLASNWKQRDYLLRLLCVTIDKGCDLVKYRTGHIFPSASVSKRVFVRNLFYEFDLDYIKANL